MSWIILVVSGAFEAVWAVALGKSEGFTRLAPSLVFFPALVVSMGGLAYAMRELPVATSYVVWVGIGAVLTAAYSFISGDEAVSVAKVALIGLITASVIGLKLLHG
jgi:quaternary ammonium compound-resistance protein SugE